MAGPAAKEPSSLQGDDSLFRTLIATAVDGIMVIDDRGIVQVYNDACEHMFQYCSSEVVGQNVKMLMPSPFRAEHDDYIERYKQTGQARIIGIGREVRGQRKDGSIFPMYLSVGSGALNGKPIFVGIIHDLTAFNREKDAREEQKSNLASIVESSNDAIASKTLEGVVTSWNSAAGKIFGYSAEEMIGQPISILFPPDRLSEEEDILGRIRAGQSVQHYETVRRRKDGTNIDVSVTISPVRDAVGKVIGASKTVRDITERKAAAARLQSLQEELNHVARMSEMSQVSAALAHELNQPLTAILNYASVAKRLIASTEPNTTAKAYEAVSKASEQAVRAGQIIRRLRDFVEKRETVRTLEDINSIAEDAIALGMIGAKVSNIKMRTKFAQNLPSILADRVQIQQVLVNLLRNAVEAMAGSPKRELTLSTARRGDSIIEVNVADTGPGIPEDVARRLFKPFVTTKSGGMGIGLAISQSIVEAHGGTLRMTPNQGGGTVFQFTLPAPTTAE